MEVQQFDPLYQKTSIFNVLYSNYLYQMEISNCTKQKIYTVKKYLHHSHSMYITDLTMIEMDLFLNF